MYFTTDDNFTADALALANALETAGVHVCGSVTDLGYADCDDAIWIAADSTPELFDYWGHDIDNDIESLASEHGFYFEWNDPGTIMAYKI